MNQEQPQFKPWKDLVAETEASIKFQLQNLKLAQAVLEEAKAQLANE